MYRHVASRIFSDYYYALSGLEGYVLCARCHQPVHENLEPCTFHGVQGKSLPTLVSGPLDLPKGVLVGILVRISFVKWGENLVIVGFFFFGFLNCFS
jgi:hypothetical protein